jgi:hypothetical protein
MNFLVFLFTISILIAENCFAEDKAGNYQKKETDLCDVAKGFNPDSVLSSTLETKNHFVVGGEFSVYRGHPVKNIAKINKFSCELDKFFTKSNGFDRKVTSIAKTDTHLFVGGDFLLNQVGLILELDK